MCGCDSVTVGLPLGSFVTGDPQSYSLSDFSSANGGAEASAILLALRERRPVWLLGLTCDSGGGGRYSVTDEHGIVASAVRMVPAGEHPPPLRTRTRSARITFARVSSSGFGYGVIAHFEIGLCQDKPCDP